MNEMVISGMHMGRSWTGNLIEQSCPCDKAACGLVISESATDCPHHSVSACKTMRQVHDADHCPGHP